MGRRNWSVLAAAFSACVVAMRDFVINVAERLHEFSLHLRALVVVAASVAFPLREPGMPFAPADTVDYDGLARRRSFRDRFLARTPSHEPAASVRAFA